LDFVKCLTVLNEFVLIIQFLNINPKNLFMKICQIQTRFNVVSLERCIWQSSSNTTSTTHAPSKTIALEYKTQISRTVVLWWWCLKMLKMCLKLLASIVCWLSLSHKVSYSTNPISSRQRKQNAFIRLKMWEKGCMMLLTQFKKIIKLFMIWFQIR